MTVPLAEYYRIRTMIIIAVAATAAAFVIPRLFPTKTDALADAMKWEMMRQGVDTAFEQRMAALPSDSARRIEGFQLARRGIARLTAPQLRGRLALLIHMDSMATPELCAARLMGTLAPAGFQEMITTLNAEQREKWVQFTVYGIGQELRAGASRRPPPPTNEEVAAAFGEIKRPLSPADLQRFDSILGNIQTAMAEDRCWASLLISKTTLEMPDPPQGAVMEVLARVEAGV